MKNSFLSGLLAITLASLTITFPASAEKNTITIGIEADLARLDPHINNMEHIQSTFTHV